MPSTEQSKHQIASAAQEAVKAIATATNLAADKLAAAADTASSAIASAALDATKLLASQANTAAKVVDVKHGDDHDRLVILDTKMDAISDQIKELKDNNAARINQMEIEKLNCRDSYPVLYKKDVEDKLLDHEKRIKFGEITDTRLISYGVALIFIVGVLEFILSTYFSR